MSVPFPLTPFTRGKMTFSLEKLGITKSSLEQLGIAKFPLVKGSFLRKSEAE